MRNIAGKVVLLTPEIVPFPNYPASISQDRVDLIVQMDDIGDPSLIGVGAARVTKNPRELLIARRAADVIEHSGYFKDGFSMQTGSGAASTAATRFLEERMSAKEHYCQFRAGRDHRRDRGSAQEGTDQDRRGRAILR